jgi:hypothetical protein
MANVYKQGIGRLAYKLQAGGTIPRDTLSSILDEQLANKFVGAEPDVVVERTPKTGDVDALFRKYVPPHLRDAFGRAPATAEGILSVIGPAADVQDMKNYSAATMDSLRAGDYSGSLANALMTGAALGMTALPGSVGGIDRAVKKLGVDDLPITPAEGRLAVGAGESLLNNPTGKGSGVVLGSNVGKPSQRVGDSLRESQRIEEALTDIDVPEITIAKPAKVDVDPRIKTTGKYRGAPANVDSPQKLGAMRSSLRQSLERGVIGKDWYQKSSDAARLLTAGRPGYRRLYTGSTALTSQGATVGANQMWGVKGYNQAITDAPINTGRFPQAVEKQLGRLRSGESIELGPKVGPFYEALNVSPGVAASRPTNDIWMARAFDYRTQDGGIWDDALGEAQHRFIDKEMENLTQWANKNKVGGYNDWTPEQVQASIWVDTKARAEKTSVEEAARDFSDNLPKLTARINVESEPALGLDHLSGVVDDENLSSLLAALQRAVLRNEEGQDVIALQTGALTRPSADGSGYYKDRSAPAEAIQILTGTKKGSSVMDPASMELATGIAATRGLLGAQESVGINFVKAGGSVIKRNAGIVDLKGPPTSAQMIEVGRKLDEAFDGNVIPVHTGEGLNYLAFWGDEGFEGSLRDWGSKNNVDLSGADDVVEKRLATAWQKQLTKISEDTLGKKPTYGIKTSKLVGSFEGYKPSAYLEEIERLNPRTRAALDSQPIRLAAQELEDIDKRLIEEDEARDIGPPLMYNEPL